MKTALLIFALLLSSTALGEPLRVAFIYQHPVNAGGWSLSHEQGRQAVTRQFDGAIESKPLEDVQPGPDTVRTLTRLAQEGYDLIFATSFGHMNPVMKVARRFPQTTFMHASGYKQARNVGTYQIRAFQGRYLAGVLAGHMSQSKQLGYVAAFPIPEVIRGINAFTLGAQSVDPDIKINVVWLNSWLDTAREREAADLLISRGNDVVTHHTETPAIMMAAEAAGAWAIGYQYDRSQFAPTRHLATIAHNWTPVYNEVIRAKLAGEWTSSSIWYGVEHSASQLVSVAGAVEQPLRDQLTDMENQISKGKLRVFSGPIYDTEGQLRVAEGSYLSDAELISQEWYVAGVNNTQ